VNQTLRWLIVEDSKADVSLMIHAVRSVGYEAKCKVVGTESAMRVALEHEDWDLITSDHDMPQFSAPAALAIAAELRPTLPFIVVSGEVDVPLAVSLMKAGARDYIQKEDLTRLAPAIGSALHETELELDRRRQAKNLEASESRYRRLFEAALDGILILDAETGDIDDVNPFMLDMLGYSREEFLEKRIWDIGAAKDVGLWKSHFLDLQNHGYIRYHDLPLEAGDGRSIDVEFVSNIYLVNGQKVIQCNIREIIKGGRARLSRVPSGPGGP
jgi:PAS domain S-box-containing protein